MRANSSRPRRSSRGVRARAISSAKLLFLEVMRHPPDRVVLRNVRQHNLKGITVEFPRRALTVITGPSGAGKSSLAFDTLYAEGQRRYIESLSTYAKQFPERMPKPLVDSMEGISPAVAIEQKNPTTSSRSTVGTATEIADFLRLLWARAGVQTCVHCGQEVKRDTVQEVVDTVIAGNGKRETIVAFPLPASAHRPDVEVAAQLRAAGFVRAQVDGAVVRLDDDGVEGRVRAGQDVLVIVERIGAASENRRRLAGAVPPAGGVCGSMRRGVSSPRATGIFFSTTRAGATSACARSSSGSRRGATSNTSASSCDSISSPRPAPAAAGRVSSRNRWRFASLEKRSPRPPRSRPPISRHGSTALRRGCRRFSARWRRIFSRNC